MAIGEWQISSEFDTSNQYIKYRICCLENSINTATNTSNVRITVNIWRTNTGYTTYGTGTVYATINGTQYTQAISSSQAITYDDKVSNFFDKTLDIPHNSDGTKTLTVSVHIDHERFSATSHSANFGLTNIPRYPSVSQSLNTKTLNSIKMNYSSDSTCDYLWYSTNNGANWTGVDIADGTSGTYTITGLSPNTTYNIKTRLRRKDSQLTADSSALSVTTYQIGQISSVSNFDHGSSTTLVTTNPSGSSLTLVMKIGNTQILSQNVSTGNNTISFNDTQLDNIYKLYGTGSSLTATFILTTAGSYTNSKTATITLKGNQKTYWTNINGSWKRAKLWTNVNGTWRRAVIWTNVNGSWKRGI